MTISEMLEALRATLHEEPERCGRCHSKLTQTKKGDLYCPRCGIEIKPDKRRSNLEGKKQPGWSETPQKAKDAAKAGGFEVADGAFSFHDFGKWFKAQKAAGKTDAEIRALMKQNEARETDDEYDARLEREAAEKKKKWMEQPKHVLTYISQGHVRWAKGTGNKIPTRTLCGAPVSKDPHDPSMMYSMVKDLSAKGREAWTLCPKCVAQMGKPGKIDA